MNGFSASCFWCFGAVSCHGSITRYLRNVVLRFHVRPEPRSARPAHSFGATDHKRTVSRQYASPLEPAQTTVFRTSAVNGRLSRPVGCTLRGGWSKTSSNSDTDLASATVTSMALRCVDVHDTYLRRRSTSIRQLENATYRQRGKPHLSSASRRARGKTCPLEPTQAKLTLVSRVAASPIPTKTYGLVKAWNAIFLELW